MRAEDALHELRDLPVCKFTEVFGGETLAILAPHPDDESLGCGGLIAEACAQGRPPFIVVLTDGAGSHPRSRQYPAERLRALRETECLAALACLGMPQGRAAFLRCPDTKAPLDGPDAAAAAEAVAALLSCNGCGTLLTTWRHDPHCDHLAAANIAACAAAMTGTRLLAYPVWGLTLPGEAELGDDVIAGFRLDIRCHLARKRSAILAHASQYGGLITDDPDAFQLAPAFIELFLNGTETFLHAAAP
jgi:LmbE family N-acetylglucosaminyl deacetylase